MDGLEYFKPDKILPLNDNGNEGSQKNEMKYEANVLVEDSSPVLSTEEQFQDTHACTHESIAIPGNQDKPLATDESDRQLKGRNEPQCVTTFSRDSSTSSSNSSSDYRSPAASLYEREFLAPAIHYSRDSINQKLIAIIGREFDQPGQIASDMQGLLQKYSDNCTAKFVPFTVRRKVLLKGTFDTRDLKQHDLICFCYNASEARILLTGPDGFYSTLLRLVEALLGPNKVAFVVANYSPPGCVVVNNANELISPVLQTRLYNQDSLKFYLDKEQVLSWKTGPSVWHLDALLRLANLDCNPVQSCSLL